MAVVEDIELRLTVDATQAQKGLDETRKAAETMGGRVGNLTEAFKNLQQRLGPSAAAISGVASALGQTNGEAGKALAAVGQVAAAFAAGGPFGAALAAGTFAVDQLSASWERSIKAQDQALASQYSQFDALNKTTKELEKQAEALRLQYEPLSPAEIRSRAQAQMGELDRIIRVNEGMSAREKGKAADYRAQNLQLEEQKALIFEIADLQAKTLERTAARQPAAPAASPERKADESLKFLKRFKAERDAALAAEEMSAFEREVESMGEQAQRLREFERLKTDIVQEGIDERIRLGLQAAEQNKAIVEQEYAAIAQIVTQSLGVVVGAFQDYVDARIKGEEDAEVAFAASIMRQAGQALISYGTQAVGTGIMQLSNPVTAPLAASSFAAGAGLIAGGVALGGVATAWTHTAAGGTIGQPLDQRSTTGGGGDMAARTRPAQPGTATGGGTQLTIVYGGLSGPTADDGARALREGLRRADRRGYR